MHHRVKNNIASIESLLFLQTDATDNPEVKTALQDALTRVQSMRVLYDKLLSAKDYHEVSIKSCAEELIDSLLAVVVLEIEVNIEMNISDFTITTKKAISVGMIINELLTNVFKYAFKDRTEGTVVSSLEKNGSKATLVIHDNGIGIDTDKAPGFGLTIVKMLVKQVKGTYSIVNDNGTREVSYSLHCSSVNCVRYRTDDYLGAGVIFTEQNLWRIKMNTTRIFGIVLLVVGVALLFFGYQASQAVGDQVTEFFTGRFTDKTMWYLIGGAVSACAGVFLTFFKKQ